MKKNDSKTLPRILAIGAHPDDCDVKAGGCAVLWTKVGCVVQFVSTTNGGAGHHEMSGNELIERRKKEAQVAGKVAGIEYLVLDNPDGQLVPGLEQRLELIRLIRKFCPDLILTHRPNDYHPDHRYTSQLVQDCAYLIGVPNICPETPRLESVPVIAWFEDNFKKPTRFAPDVAIDIDSVIDTKLTMLECHESQVYEWLPWIDQHGLKLPGNPDHRRRALYEFIHRFSQPGDSVRQLLVQSYGEPHGNSVVDAESFEGCEYGAPLDATSIKRLFPF